MNLRPRALTGTHIRLEPVTPAHHEEMRVALDCDQANWDIQFVCARGAHFAEFWEKMLHAPGRIAFAVRDVSPGRREKGGSAGEGRLAGTSSFLFFNPEQATLEIGSTWFRPEYRGGAVNPEAKLLMLGEAFGEAPPPSAFGGRSPSPCRGGLRARRVEFRVDARNAVSQAAMLKLGAVREGVIRQHLVTWTGHVRDSVIFSILADEWPRVREGLEARLADRR